VLIRTLAFLESERVPEYAASVVRVAKIDDGVVAADGVNWVV